MHTVTTDGAGGRGSPRRTSRRAALPIVGCLALAGWVGACGSDKDTTGAAATTAPPAATKPAATTASPPTTPAVAPTTPAVTRAATTSVATATTPTATTSAAAAGPSTSFIFRTEHGEVPDGAVEIIADDGKFDVHAIEAKPGRLVVHLSNIEDFDVRHDFLITDQQKHRLARSDKVAAGDDIVFVVEDLKPGTYPYLCSLEGHAAAGMNGVLTVTDG